MSEVKKIQVDGVSYDLGGGSGLSDDAKNALLDCFAHVAWVDDEGQQYVDALQAALFDNTWNVTNTLSNCVTSNPSGTVAKDGIYSATISAVAGYTLEGATVSVTMNGANVTSSVYNNGTILIPTVTGDVVITVVAVVLTVVSISAVYTQSGTVYNTDSLDSLKADLVVTATFSDTSSGVITDYTLSGSLSTSTSTITVTYGGQTATFDVSVTVILYPLLNGEYATDNGQYRFTITKGHHCKCEVLRASSATTTNFTMLNCFTGAYSISNSNSVNNQSAYFTIPTNKDVTLKLKNVVNSANGGTIYPQFIVLMRNANASTSFLATSQSEHNTDVTVSGTTSSATAIGAVGFGVNGFKYLQGAYCEFDLEITVGDDVYVGGRD